MTTAVTSKQTRQSIQSLVNSPEIRARFEKMLGARTGSFLSSVISAVSANEMLLQADPTSVLQAAAVAASIDLPINASLGLAHIVPYKKSGGVFAQFQIGWKGFIQLAIRSGQYKTINSAVVHEGEIKEINPFTGEIEFTGVEAKPNAKTVGYLLYFRLLNGFEKYFYMTAGEVENHAKRYSKAYKSGFGPWVDNFDTMALKTVVKQGLSKYGIVSIEMQRAIETDQGVLKESGEVAYIDSGDGEISKEVAQARPVLEALQESGEMNPHLIK